MRKDIQFEASQGVHLAVVLEGQDDWKVYLHNTNDTAIDTVLVASHGHGMINGEERKTSTLRHMIESIEANAMALVEPIQTDLFVLTNEYWVTYYLNGQIYDKKFVLDANTIDAQNLEDIPSLSHKGILLQ